MDKQPAPLDQKPVQKWRDDRTRMLSSEQVEARASLEKLSVGIATEPLLLMSQAIKLVNRLQIPGGTILTDPMLRITANLDGLTAQEIDRVLKDGGNQVREAIVRFVKETYDPDEIDPGKMTPDMLLDLLSTIDEQFEKYLQNSTEGKKDVLKPVLTPRSRRSIAYTDREVLRAKEGEATDSKIRGEYGAYVLEPTPEDFNKRLGEMLNQAPNDMAHQVTCMVLFDMISNKAIAKRNMLSHLYEAGIFHENDKVKRNVLLNSQALYTYFGKPLDERGKEYRHWRQCGAMPIFLPTKEKSAPLRINVSYDDVIRELTITFPANPLFISVVQGFYRGNEQSTQLLYRYVKNRITDQLTDVLPDSSDPNSTIEKTVPPPQKAVTKHIRPREYDRAYVKATEKKLTGVSAYIQKALSRFHVLRDNTPQVPIDTEEDSFTRADIQVNFARASQPEFAKVANISTITGNPSEATPHVHTLFVDDNGAVNRLQTKTSHRFHNGIIYQELMEGDVKELDSLSRMIVNDVKQRQQRTPDSSPALQTTEKLSPLSQEKTTELQHLVEMLPIQDVTIAFTGEEEKALREKDKLGSINDTLLPIILGELKITEPEKRNDIKYLLNADWLHTMGIGILANLAGTECHRMDFLIETPTGDITPAMVPIPTDVSSDYKAGMEQSRFVPSVKRGRTLALAFGITAYDRQMALDPIYSAGAQQRLAVAAGSKRNLLNNLAKISDARGILTRNGTGGLVSRLPGKFSHFTGAMSSYHEGQPSMTIVMNDQGEKQLTLVAEKKQSELLSMFTKDNMKKIEDFILEDLKAYQKTLVGQQ